MSTVKTQSKGASSSGDLGSLDDLAREMGLDPTTLPDLSQPAPSKRDVIEETAARYTERIVEEHLRRDLRPDEAALVHGAIWINPATSQGATPDKARSIWRMVTFMRRYGVRLSDIPAVMLVPGLHRRGSSSTVHRWAHAGFWNRAQEVLSPLPFSEWSQARRDELADLVAWEESLKANAERRKAKRIHDQAIKESTNGAQRRR